MSGIELACATDAAYLPHLAVMLRSAAAHRGQLELRARVLLGDDVDPAAELALARMLEGDGAQLVPYRIPRERVAGLPVVDEISEAMWFRILLPELAADVARVLYLDADTIVVDSLEPLWATELSGQPLAAVTNVLEAPVMSHPEEIGLAGPLEYFNSGVLVLDLDAMRREGTADRLRTYALSHARLRWPDQDALNVVFAGRRVALHPRWNLMNSVRHFPWAPYVFGWSVVTEARTAPAIRHFEGPGPNKPWDYRCEPEMQALYAGYRAGTPWPRYVPRGRTVGRVARRRAGRVRQALRARSVRP